MACCNTAAAVACALSPSQLEAWVIQGAAGGLQSMTCAPRASPYEHMQGEEQHCAELRLCRMENCASS